MKLLLALVLLTLSTTFAQAREIARFVLEQPLAHIREVCAAEMVPEWGCVTRQQATDNPNDIICIIRIPVTDRPWEENALLERLRPQCMEQP